MATMISICNPPAMYSRKVGFLITYQNSFEEKNKSIATMSSICNPPFLPLQ